jgi:hypothetical protein
MYIPLVRYALMESWVASHEFLSATAHISPEFPTVGRSGPHGSTRLALWEFNVELHRAYSTNLKRTVVLSTGANSQARLHREVEKLLS